MTNKVKIELLEKGIKSPMTPENLKEKMREQLKELKSKKEDTSAPIRNKNKEDILSILYNADNKGWYATKAVSGDEIKDSDELTKKYASAVSKELKEIKKGSLSEDIYSELELNNYHLLNEFLIWNGYFGKELTAKNKDSYINIWERGKRQVANPEAITIGNNKPSLKSTKTITAKKATKKYYPNREIKSVTVMEAGKPVVYAAKDILNGANFLEKGGEVKLKDNYDYVPIRKVISVELMDGSIVKPVNGYHIKATARPIKYENGGKILNNYEGKTAEEVWNKWTLKQREHFLSDHYDVIEPSDLGAKGQDFNDLDFLTQAQLQLHLDQGQYEFGGPVELPEGSFIHYQNWYLEKGGRIDKNHVIKLNYLELTPLSTQLKRYTGDSLNVHDYQSEDGNEYKTNPGSIIVHTKSGLRFLVPDSLYRYVDGYNLVLDKENNEIVVFEDGKLVAEIVNGKLDFTFKNDSISINRSKVEKEFENGFIPEKKPVKEYEDFDFEAFLNYIYPNLKDIFEQHGLKLSKDFTVYKGKEDFISDIMYSSVDGLANNLVIAFYDKKMDLVGTIDFNLNKQEIKVNFDNWKIHDVDFYKLGGHVKSAWKHERKYVNKQQPYEVEYAKGKNRTGYKKLEKGGETTKNELIGKYAKVPMGSGLFHYGKIIGFSENSNFSSENGYSVSGFGDTLKREQFEIVSKRSFENLKNKGSEVKENSFFLNENAIVNLKDKKPRNINGNPIFALAKEIRKPNEEWKSALKRAQQQIKNQ